MSTVAGVDAGGFSGDGGPATSALLAVPTDVATDAAGNTYILDVANQRVRKVSAGMGLITTVAGSGSNLFGFGGDGGPATRARLALYAPNNFGSPGIGAGLGVAVDGSGDVFINDVGNNRVRRVDGRSGIITTVAGNGNSGDGLGDGGPATAAAGTANDVAVDGAGNLYIADRSGRVRRVDASTGIISTVAGGGSPADGLGDGGPATAAAVNAQCVTFDRAGDLLVCDGNGGRVRRVDGHAQIITTVAGGGSPADGLGDGGPATAAALGLVDVGVDGAGDLIISDTNQNRLRRVDARNGIITTIAGGAVVGDGGPATSAILGGPTAVATFGTDTYIADFSQVQDFGAGWVRKVDGSGIITTFAGGGSPADGLGDGGPAAAAALTRPKAVAVDGAGNVFVIDGNGPRVRRVDARTLVITTVAGGGSPADGLGDGGPATSAALLSPNGIFVVGAGNRRWPAGTLFIADGPRVRMVDPAGAITTVAGTGDPTFGGDRGPATKAGLGAADVVADPAGDLFIADQANSRIRRVDARSGIITTVAGDGAFGLAGVGGPATKAHLNNPHGLTLDPAGNLYIADGYMRVVKLDAAGNLQLVAGTGVPGFGGDGGPAVNAELLHIGHLALDSAGNVLIADRGDSRVRLVRPGAAAPPAGCGEIITASTTLNADLGPCPRAGIIVGADNVTLNLNGHRIFGSGTAQDGQQAGVMISGRTGVTVTGGQVDHFSEGVAVINSTKTTVSHMTVRDNLGSYDLLAFGDGIVLYYSAHNQVLATHLFNNGPYDNVAVLGRLSDYNLIQGNTITDSASIDNGRFSGVGENLHSNAFSDPALPDRGASLVGNQIMNNTVVNAYANGISNLANTQAQIIGNTVKGSGVGDPANGVGIGVQQLNQSTPLTQDLVEGNIVVNNTGGGLQDWTIHNRWIDNTALGNGPGQYGDTNLDCFTTTGIWLGNTYATSAGPCPGGGNHQVPPPAAPSTNLGTAVRRPPASQTSPNAQRVVRGG